MKRIIVNVIGLSVEEKQRVNEALAKIKGIEKPSSVGAEVAWFFAPSRHDKNEISWDGVRTFKAVTATHTPQQVLEMAEMAEMAKQGHVHAHVHAESMALYAEDAKTTDKPWGLWQTTTADHPWIDLQRNPEWNPLCLYRRKPKNHIVHGVEVPDLRVIPNEGEEHYLPDPLVAHLYKTATNTTYQSHCHRVSNNLCYEHTEAGKQAAILHAKAWLGIE